MKLCKDCIAFIPGHTAFFAQCGQSAAASPVDGTTVYVSCDTMRSEDGRCGPGATLFHGADERGKVIRISEVAR